MATLILTSILALIALAIAVVPVTVILWQDAHSTPSGARNWDVLPEAQRIVAHEGAGRPLAGTGALTGLTRQLAASPNRRRPSPNRSRRP